MSTSAKLFSIFNTAVYYGGDLLFPLIILFIIYISGSVMLSRRLTYVREQVRNFARDRGSGGGEILKAKLTASVKEWQLEKYNRYIDVMLWFICCFPVLGLSGTLIGTSKIGVASVNNDFSLQVLRLGIIESISSTICGLAIFLVTYVIYRLLIRKYNDIITQVLLLAP